MTNGGHFDVLVVGAGPAGSVTALLLARAGARVALVDKSRFPRDKACGDLVGPRGVGLLGDLGVLPPGRRLGEMEVAGPTGRVVRLPAPAGLTYPGEALAVSRRRFDDGLRQAALDAGAEAMTARASSPLFAGEATDGTSPRLQGFRLEATADHGLDVRADVVIGADGALSRVAAACELVDERAVLWGFALRGYADGAAGPVRPRISFWEPSRGAGYPGYAWEFPGEDGVTNVGIGAAARGSRRFATRVPGDLDAFRTSRPGRPTFDGQLGGWLKLGIVGTVPARGRALLVGDAAGLVNPLQGEGIGPAMESGRLAAEAVLAAGPNGAAVHYLTALERRFAPFAAQTAPLTALMLRRPRLTAVAGRVLTAPFVGRGLAGAWALYWNDLVDGATPGPWRAEAAVARRVFSAVTSATAERGAVRSSFAGAATENPTPTRAGSGAYDRRAPGLAPARARAEGGR